MSQTCSSARARRWTRPTSGARPPSSPPPRAGTTSVATLLVRAGAKVGLVEAALLGEAEDVSQMLGWGRDIDTQNASGMTALMAAVATGQADLCVYLLDRGADLELRDSFGRTALVFAVSQAAARDRRSPAGPRGGREHRRTTGRRRCAAAADEPGRRTDAPAARARGADVASRDKRGWTPMHYATLQGQRRGAGPAPRLGRGHRRERRQRARRRCTWRPPWAGRRPSRC